MPREYNLKPNLHHSSFEYSNLEDAIVESKTELLELEGDMEACSDAKYTNLRKQRAKLVIKLMKQERKLVCKKDAAAKAKADWINDSTAGVEANG